MGHKASVRPANHVDPLSVHRKLPADLFDQSAQIAGVIDTAVKKITTAIGSIPELVARSVEHTVRAAVEKSSRLRQRSELPVAFHVLNGVAGVTGVAVIFLT